MDKFADALRKKLEEETGASKEWMDKHLIISSPSSFLDDDDETEDRKSTPFKSRYLVNSYSGLCL